MLCNALMMTECPDSQVDPLLMLIWRLIVRKFKHTHTNIDSQNHKRKVLDTQRPLKLTVTAASRGALNLHPHQLQRPLSVSSPPIVSLEAASSSDHLLLSVLIMEHVKWGARAEPFGSLNDFLCGDGYRQCGGQREG